jgi:hypothetical protein
MLGQLHCPPTASMVSSTGVHHTTPIVTWTSLNALDFLEKTATICGKSIQTSLIANRCLPFANTPGYESSPGTKTQNLLSAWNAAKSLIPRNFMTWRLKKSPMKGKTSRKKSKQPPDRQLQIAANRPDCGSLIRMRIGTGLLRAVTVWSGCNGPMRDQPGVVEA